MISVAQIENLSDGGICRVTGVSLTWLLHFVSGLYCALPDDLNVTLSQSRKGAIRLVRLEAEADEIWSFAVSKENKQWVWIALDVATKQVLAFYVGDRSASSARELWRHIPQVYRDHATFYTDGLAAYKTVLPAKSHQVCAKSSGAYEHDRTTQLHAATTGISPGPILIELFKDCQESYRSDQILHLLL